MAIAATSQSIWVDAAQAGFRLSGGQNATVVMLAHSQARRTVDPAFRHHRQVMMT